MDSETDALGTNADFARCVCHSVPFLLSPLSPFHSQADMSQRASPAASASALSAAALAAAPSASVVTAAGPRHGHAGPNPRAEDSDREKQTATPDPSPIRRLHRHALESVLGFFSKSGLATALRVSREWNAAVKTMPSVRFTFATLSADSLLPVLHSPLARHLGVFDVRWESNRVDPWSGRPAPWSGGPAIMAQLVARLKELSDVSCTEDRLESGLTAVARPPPRNPVVVTLTLDGPGGMRSWLVAESDDSAEPNVDRIISDPTDDLFAAMDQLTGAVGTQPAARPWLSPLSTARCYFQNWGRYRAEYFADSDDDEAAHAHALITQLCTHCPALESLTMDLLTPLADLRTISERLPHLHTLHVRLPTDDLIKHIAVPTSEQRRSAMLEGLDAVDVIPDLAALCADYVQSEPAVDARLTVTLLPLQSRDVSLLIRDPEPEYNKPFNPFALLQLTTAVVRSLHALPQLTALELDLMPLEGCNEVPRDYLPGFDWSLLAELTSLTALSLRSTCSDPDYRVAIVWDEAAAIATLRQLTQLTSLDVSGFARSHIHVSAPDHGGWAFDIVSFARPPVAHPALREMRVGCAWAHGRVVWSADQCAAFRQLPMLQRIDGKPIDAALNSAANPQRRQEG